MFATFMRQVIGEDPSRLAPYQCGKPMISVGFMLFMLLKEQFGQQSPVRLIPVWMIFS
jgi:hypothetical protein